MDSQNAKNVLNVNLLDIATICFFFKNTMRDVAKLEPN